MLKKLTYLILLVFSFSVLCCYATIRQGKSSVEPYNFTPVKSGVADTQLDAINTPLTYVETEASQKLEPCVKIRYDNISDWEKELLARLVYLESGNCSLDCQKAVASVVLNRLDSNCWRTDVDEDGKITLYDIIYYPKAFSPSSKIPETTPSKSCYEAVEYVVTHGPILPPEIRYFRADYEFSWSGYINCITLDNMYFGYMENWIEGIW